MGGSYRWRFVTNVCWSVPCSWPIPVRCAPRCAVSSARPPRSAARAPKALAGDAAEAGVLDLGVVEDAVTGALASAAGFLDAAERGHLGGDEAGVDADHAVFQ